jgi:cobyrinic acid a,c-diamide synthase
LTARLVIAGTASGVGKTTVVVGLVRALRARGLRVAVFKCGPDYLDPTYHARAAGVASHNLDGWMMGQDAVRATFARVAAGADIAVIEGVMGLFDGVAPTSNEGSTAEIARWLEAPVLLVVDASGMARSLAALVRGFAGFDPGLNLAGVLCNRVGSKGHLELLARAVEKTDPPVLGGLLEDAALAFPERHLGLRTADEQAVPEERFEAWGARTTETVGLDAVLRIAQSAPALPVPRLATAPVAAHCRIGVAHDAAFHFYYDDNLRRLEQLGAELVRFSPLHDAELPRVDGVLIGGGYPEVHAAALAANRGMRAALTRFAGEGGPIYGECGGLMYLARAIRTLDGQEHEMLGLLPGVAVMHPKLRALGYVEVETQSATVLGGAGLRFRGHQFRYSDLVLEPSEQPELAYSVRRRRAGDVIPEGYRRGSVLGSYVHAHWASNPQVAAGFVAACEAWRRAQ